MAVIANMATFPARAQTLLGVLERLSPQVDRINLVLNGYGAIPDGILRFENVSATIPGADLKDVGKFLPPHAPDDFVFLCDDDLIYPDDYVDVMLAYYGELASLRAVIGLHGIIYSDFFDGDPLARLVHVFRAELPRHELVNQLGSGTILIRGYQMPPFDFMQGSENFVDLRLAVYCFYNRFPMVCVRRRLNWVGEIKTETSIFVDFTKRWPVHVVREAQQVAGFAKLDLAAVRRLKEVNGRTADLGARKLASR